MIDLDRIEKFVCQAQGVAASDMYWLRDERITLGAQSLGTRTLLVAELWRLFRANCRRRRHLLLSSLIQAAMR